MDNVPFFYRKSGAWGVRPTWHPQTPPLVVAIFFGDTSFHWNKRFFLRINQNMNFFIKYEQQRMTYFVLLNVREFCPSECKLKWRWLWDMYKYKLTHGTPHKMALYSPPPQSNFIVSQDLSLKPLEMFMNCRQSICLWGRAE